MKFVIYKDVSGKWRWRLVTANGKIIADGGEGYWNYGDVVASINNIKKNAPYAQVFVPNALLR